MSQAPQIKASVKLQSKIRKVHLTVRQMVFADLLAIGYEAKDAYQISGIYDPVLMPAENWKNMRTLMETNEAFNNYIPSFVANTEHITYSKPSKKKTQDQEQPDSPISPSHPTDPNPVESPGPSSHAITDEEMNEMLSKDNQLKDLLYKLKYGNLDDKTEMDVRKMIADLTRIKNEQSQSEEKKTVVYLPLACHDCSLYLKAKSDKMDNKSNKKNK